MTISKRSALFVAMGVLMLAGAIATWKRHSVMAWYYAWQLSTAEHDRCTAWAPKIESLGHQGTQAVIHLWRGGQDIPCRNAAIVLGELLHHWGWSDSRAKAALEYASATSDHFSPAGQRECLGLLHYLLSESREISPELSGLAARLLGQLGARPDTRHSALQLTAELLRRDAASNESFLTQARAWVVAGLQDSDAAVRIAAVRLAALPSLQALELLPALVTEPQVDSSGEVRQLVILAIGNVEALISTEALCRFLNDEVAGVRTAADQALRARGLSRPQVELARLIQHPSPASRAQLPALVLEVPEVDSLTWMERLSRDPAPAVRAATARAMGQQPQPRFSGLIRHLAESDADETVQAIARYFSFDQNK